MSLIQFNATTAWSVYAVFKNAAGEYWNQLSGAFETYAGANWTATKYAVAGSEPSAPGDYVVTVPAMPAGLIYWTAYRRVGGSPATSDTHLANDSFQWSGAGFNAAIGSAGSGSVTVGELRTALRYSGRNVGIADTDESVYDLTEKDLAIQGLLNHFIRRTRCTSQHNTISISADATQVSFSAIDGFHPERLKGQRLWLLDSNSKPTLDLREDFGDLLAARAVRRSETGAPEESGFTDASTLEIWPKADAAYTLHAMWSPPLTAWTAGDNAAGTTALNVPKDLAITAVRSGGVVWLQNGQIEDVPLTDRNRAAYDAHVAASMGLGSLSGPSSSRSSLDCLARRRWRGG